MTELNTQYANIPAAAAAGATVGINMQRNALLQDDQAMKRQEYDSKQADAAQKDAAMYFYGLHDLPEEKRATEYPVVAKILKARYKLPGIQSLPNEYNQEVGQRINADVGAIKAAAALKRTSSINPAENMKIVQDPTSPTGWSHQNVFGYSMQGAPAPAEHTAQTAASEKARAVEIRQRKNLGQSVTPEEEAWLKSHETEAGLTSTARMDAIYGGAPMPNDWTPEEWEVALEKHLYEGKPPDLGGGFASTKPKLQYASGWNKYLVKLGISGKEAIAQQSEYKGDVQSLVSATKNLDAIKGFAKGASESFNIITDLQKAWGNGEFPRVNKWSQLFAYETGDPRVKALQNAVTTSMLEYMKVTTAGTGVSSAELSVGAQQRALELIRASDTPETMTQAIATMRREMGVIEKARQQQKDEILARLHTSKVGSSRPQQPKSQYTPEEQEQAKEEIYRRHPELRPGAKK